MMSRCLGELYPAGLIHGLDQLRREIAAPIAAHRARESIPWKDVLDEDIEDFLTSGVTFHRDGFDPTRETVGEHH